MSKIKTQQQILRNLLTKAKSTASNISQRPVDEASISIGKQMAKVFLSLFLESKGVKEKGEWSDIGDELVRTLQVQVNLSIGYGFFHGLANGELWSNVAFDVAEEFIHWWAHCIWVYDRENPFSSDDILVFCVKGFIKLASQFSTNSMFSSNGSDDSLYLASVYQKCKTRTRILIIRECISVATDMKMTNAPSFLSPLFLQVVSGSLVSSDTAITEARTFISYLFLNLRILFRTRHIECAFSWMEWIVQEMDEWFVIIHSNEQDENYHQSLIVFIDTLNDLSEVFMILMGYCDTSNLVNDIDEMVSSFVQWSCNVIIPDLCKNQMSYLLRQFGKSLHIITSMRSIKISESSILSLLICSLIVIEEYDTILLLEIVKSVIKDMKSALSVTVLRAISVIGSMHRNHVSDFLLDFAGKYLNNSISHIFSGRGDEVLSALINSKRWTTILKPLTRDGQIALMETLSKNDDIVSPKNVDVFSQCEALLLCTTIFLNQSSSKSNSGFYFLRCLLSEFPHLGRRCLNVCTHLIQIWLVENKAPNTLPMIEFLCDTVAADAVCAAGIWSLLTSMIEKNHPAKMKCMVIRLFPLLCKSNKRIYSRVINALGSFSEHPNSMIRATTSITINEMAKIDVIRDVSDITGWIQSFLSDDEPLVTMHAILSLHNLILHGYLDFSIVVKVLKKKLVAVDDVPSLIKLPSMVLEAIIQLLGDANQERKHDSDSDDPEHDSSHVVISIHEQAALQGLLGLAHYFTKKMFNIRQDNVDESSMNALIQQTFTSLSKYSISFMGIDFDMIRGDIQTDYAQPYSDLQAILVSGFEILKVNYTGDVHEFHIVSIIKNLCAFEEDALGPATWISMSSFKTKHASLPDIREGITAARDGTMINFLVNQLRDNSTPPSYIALVLGCLQDIPLPTSLIPLLKHYILLDETTDYKSSVIGTILAQLRRERRAASERRDYLRLASDILQLPSDLFWKKLGVKGGSIFLSGIPIIFAHLSTDAVREILSLLWEHSKVTGTTEATLVFVVALYNVIGTSKSSPASIKFIQNFLNNIKADISCLPDHVRLELKLHLMQHDTKEFDILSEMNLLSFSGYFSPK